MSTDTALHEVLRDFARTLVSPYDVGDVLYRLSDGVADVLGVDGVGVCIGDSDGLLRYVAATDETVASIERIQEDLQEGPCRDTFTTGRQTVEEDLTGLSRWPRFAPGALGAGMRSVAAFPMSVGEQRIGALNIYSAVRREWSRQDREAAQLLADVASSYVVNARELERRASLAGQLQHALDSRVAIEQAKGVLAERHGLAVEAAFQLLRHHARRTGTKLHDVARGVVDGSVEVDVPSANGREKPSASSAGAAG